MVIGRRVFVGLKVRAVSGRKMVTDRAKAPAANIMMLGQEGLQQLLGELPKSTFQSMEQEVEDQKGKSDSKKQMTFGRNDKHNRVTRALFGVVQM